MLLAAVVILIVILRRRHRKRIKAKKTAVRLDHNHSPLGLTNALYRGPQYEQPEHIYEQPQMEPAYTQLRGRYVEMPLPPLPSSDGPPLYAFAASTALTTTPSSVPSQYALASSNSVAPAVEEENSPFYDLGTVPEEDGPLYDLGTVPDEYLDVELSEGVVE